MIAALWRRVAAALDLDRLGIRRTWTIRRPHGVYTVALRQSPFGDRILLDGRAVARLDAFAYDAVARFAIDGIPAEVRVVTDTAQGTLTSHLFVAGDAVAPDVRTGPPPVATRWGMVAERAAYALAGTLVLGGVAGGPVTDAVRQVIWTGALLVLFAGLRAIDPLGAITVAFDKMLEDQPSMIIAGLEVAAIAALARDRRGLRRRIPFLGARRTLPRILGWTAVALTAFIILMLS